MTRENDIHKSSSMGTQSRATCSHTVWGSFRARGECSGQTLAAEAVLLPLWPLTEGTRYGSLARCTKGFLLSITNTKGAIKQEQLSNYKGKSGENITFPNPNVKVATVPLLACSQQITRDTGSISETRRGHVPAPWITLRRVRWSWTHMAKNRGSTLGWRTNERKQTNKKWVYYNKPGARGLIQELILL